jgi:hypothetical protein
MVVRDRMTISCESKVFIRPLAGSGSTWPKLSRDSELRVSDGPTVHFCLQCRMPVQQLHDNQKSEPYTRNKLDISGTATQSCSHCDEAAAIHDHPVVPRQKRSWLPILVLVSISFGFISLFPRALPSWPRPFLIPYFSDATVEILSDTTLLTPTSPAFSSNGRTDQVQWDNYTLILHGQRVLI